MSWGVYLYPGNTTHATQSHDDIDGPIATRSVFLSLHPTTQIRDGGEKRCRMSKPQEPSSISRRVATVIRSSSSMNSHRTFVDGKPKCVTSPVATVALPTMPEATHPVMSPKTHLCIAGSSRSTTSPL